MTSIFHAGLIAGFVLALATCGMIAAAVVADRMRKVRLAFADGDTNSGKIVWAKPTVEGEVVMGRGKKRRRYRLQGRGMFGAGYGRFFIVHPKHGWNMIPEGDASVPLDTYSPPTNQEMESDGTLKRLVISNPYSYEYAIKHNDTQDALQANAEKPHWSETIGPWLFGMVIAVLLLVLYLTWKLSQTPAPGVTQ